MAGKLLDAQDKRLIDSRHTARFMSATMIAVNSLRTNSPRSTLNSFRSLGRCNNDG